MSTASNRKRNPMRGSLKNAPGKTLRSALTGDMLSSDFFKKHLLKIFIGLVLVMVYISTKYECMTGMETIRTLENRLEVIKTEHIRERSHYMSRIRESSMSEIADSVRPGLAVQQQPPYILYLDN